ncbi:MAG TPA: CopG family transcriptional regulator [Burkholderiales bacterium]|nr:CopG family transcriptional regulator [Burkholderiales bacterium]
MAATTTLKLPEALKAQVAQLAEAAGQSPHAWMLEAIEAQAKQTEKRRSFHAEARQSLAQYERTAVAYRAEDVHRYVLARASGRKARRPRPVKR